MQAMEESEKIFHLRFQIRRRGPSEQDQILAALCELPLLLSFYCEWYAQGDASSLVDLRHSRACYTIAVILYHLGHDLAESVMLYAVF